LLSFYRILTRFFVLSVLRWFDSFAFDFILLLITSPKLMTDQVMTSAMTSLEQSLPPTRRCASRTEFHAWLARAKLGEQLEYHRGHLIWDRSPASVLTQGERQALAKIANAVFQAAEQGKVHLVQRRRGPFDFSYLAIRAVRSGNRRAVAIDHAAAQRLPLCSEAA
jgi:hypothetical protein